MENVRANTLLEDWGLIPEPIQWSQNREKKVIVGLSGGVDSSVAAYILKSQGFQVIGVFMKNWEDSPNCPAQEDFQDVIKVAELLDIPYYSVNFAQEYKEKVFNYFLEQYHKGLTPNPDILCNSEIKFDVFYHQAMKLGADFMATGHYCRVDQKNRKLLKGLDPGKDQSYFLHGIESEVLEKVLFPIGDLHKSQVRLLAQVLGLSNAQKKDSTGICFIGEKNFAQFLSQYIETQKGDFIHFDTGAVIGKHKGQCFYTLGQRKGLGLGGPGEPWFVVDKNPQNNQVFVARGQEHPALFSQALYAAKMHWLIEPESSKIDCKAKVRYRQTDQKCQVTLLSNNQVYVEFERAQRSVTPNQSLVLYKDDLCLGGGLIEKSVTKGYDLYINKLESVL